MVSFPASQVRDQKSTELMYIAAKDSTRGLRKHTDYQNTTAANYKQTYVKSNANATPGTMEYLKHVCKDRPDCM